MLVSSANGRGLVPEEVVSVATGFPISGSLLSQITFFEDRNFQGRCYACSGDCADLQAYITRCNSIRVDCGLWVLYEQTNYKGYQYFLRRGEYPDYQQWMGLNDSIRSCRSIPRHDGSYRMRIYAKENCTGQMMEFTEDCTSIPDIFRQRDVLSCSVMDGYWVLYEQPNYQGRQYFVRPGEYRRPSEWGASHGSLGSLRRATDTS
ncbi:gamma-crystallin B-like [Tachyglossus aculeatus]|uniref:gamma-crystallin B-like n=1 Tax=Tachyglossus aculeatus TaxID=9261 RepID=UPI0018F2B4DC|nr:gamma-crystallin B-like [Tachyglossus aculeatus]